MQDEETTRLEQSEEPGGDGASMQPATLILTDQALTGALIALQQARSLFGHPDLDEQQQKQARSKLKRLIEVGREKHSVLPKWKRERMLKSLIHQLSRRPAAVTPEHVPEEVWIDLGMHQDQLQALKKSPDRAAETLKDFLRQQRAEGYYGREVRRNGAVYATNKGGRSKNMPLLLLIAGAADVFEEWTSHAPTTTPGSPGMVFLEATVEAAGYPKAGTKHRLAHVLASRAGKEAD
jgi:hypothetical protein